jgi:hypothetical protein
MGCGKWRRRSGPPTGAATPLDSRRPRPSHPASWLPGRSEERFEPESLTERIAAAREGADQSRSIFPCASNSAMTRSASASADDVEVSSVSSAACGAS